MTHSSSRIQTVEYDGNRRVHNGDSNQVQYEANDVGTLNIAGRTVCIFDEHSGKMIRITADGSKATFVVNLGATNTQPVKINKLGKPVKAAKVVKADVKIGSGENTATTIVSDYGTCKLSIMLKVCLLFVAYL